MKQGWEIQDERDERMATDSSSDRNMLDFCDYYPTGKSYVTLAGLMKIANEMKFTSEIYDVSIDEHKVNVIMKVSTPDGEDMYSGRTEFTKDINGRPDRHALTKAINIATKNAVKQLLYGHQRVEELLTEFEKNVKFIPPVKPEAPKQQEPPKQKQQEPPKQEPPKQDKVDTKLSQRDHANAVFANRKGELEKISKHEDPCEVVLQHWVKYFLHKQPEDMKEADYKRVSSELGKSDMGIIGRFFSKPPANLKAVLNKYDKKTETDTKNTDDKKNEPNTER